MLRRFGTRGNKQEAIPVTLGRGMGKMIIGWET